MQNFDFDSMLYDFPAPKPLKEPTITTTEPVVPEEPKDTNPDTPKTELNDSR